MRYTMITLLLSGVCSVAAAAGNKATEEAKQLSRKKLVQETQIAGYTCARGNAWFFADGRLRECKVPRGTDFGVARVPGGSWINLTEDGRPAFVFLEQDTEIGGYRCEGGNRLLGPTEGARTAFYPSGMLLNCWLAADHDVQGVPCAHSGMFSGDSSVKFYESGSLRSCKLSRDYGGVRRGERFAR